MEDDDEKIKQEKRLILQSGIKCVLGGFLLHLFLGWIYLWGNISIYVASYFYQYDKSMNLNKVNMVFSLTTLAQGLFTPFGPFLLKKLHPRKWLIMGTTLALSGIFISTFMTNFYLFSIFYALFFGTGIGIWYLVPVTWAWQYFPDSKGLVTGIIVGGIGFGSFVFSFFSTSIINPYNLHPELKISGGLIFVQPEIVSMTPVLLRYLFVAWLLLSLAAISLIHGNPHDWQDVEAESHQNDLKVRLLEKDEEEHPDEYEKFDHHTHRKIREYIHEHPNYAILTFREAIFSMNSLMIWFMIIFSASYGMFMAHTFKALGIASINDDLFMTTVGSIGAVVNGCSRSAWAMLIDKYSFKRIFCILLIIQILLSATLVNISEIGKESWIGKPLYMIWIWASFFWLGGHYSMFPTETSKLYGVITGSEVYSKFLSTYLFS